jgi:hypothetical protein
MYLPALSYSHSSSTPRDIRDLEFDGNFGTIAFRPSYPIWHPGYCISSRFLPYYIMLSRRIFLLVGRVLNSTASRIRELTHLNIWNCLTTPPPKPHTHTHTHTQRERERECVCVKRRCEISADSPWVLYEMRGVNISLSEYLSKPGYKIMQIVNIS